MATSTRIRTYQLSTLVGEGKGDYGTQFEASPPFRAREKHAIEAAKLAHETTQLRTLLFVHVGKSMGKLVWDSNPEEGYLL